MSRTQLSLYLTAFIVAAIVIFTLVIFSLFFRDTSPPVVPVSPLPSSFERGIPSQSLPPQVLDTENLSKHPDGTIPEQTMNESSEKMVAQDQLVGQFIKKLPVQTPTFGLRYDIDTNSFIVSFIQGRVTQANRDFDRFLQENGILNRNWLYNLTVKQLTY